MRSLDGKGLNTTDTRTVLQQARAKQDDGSGRRGGVEEEGEEDPKPPNEKTALVLASQVPDVLIQCIQFIALQAAPFENVDHSCLYAAKRQKTSQLGDLPPGAMFSDRSQERSWKSWEALGDTCGHISVPFLNVLEVLRRPRQTNSKAVPCILQVTEGFFPLVT